MPSRDLGLDHGAGKGDAPRNMSAKFYANFADIDWEVVAVDMERRGTKLVKSYGPAPRLNLWTGILRGGV